MRYTLKRRRNVRQTRKKGGVIPNNRARQQHQMERLLKQGTATRRLIPKEVKFNKAHVRTYEVNNKNASFNPVVRRSTTRRLISDENTELRNIGLPKNWRSRVNAEVARLYAEIQGRSNDYFTMMNYVEHHKNYRKLPREIKEKLHDKILQNFGPNIRNFEHNDENY
jgi:hypothetical protein